MFELGTEKSPGNCFDTSEKEWLNMGSQTLVFQGACGEFKLV